MTSSGYSILIQLETSIWFCIFPATLDSVGLELLVSRGHTSEKGPQARVPLNYKLWLLPRDFVILESSNQQVKRGVTILAYMTDPEKDEEVGLL